MSFLDLDHWSEIYASLSKNKTRTALTAFGVFWGIFMLMLLLGSGNGLRNGISSDFSGGAPTAFYVWTQRTTKPYKGLPPGRSFDFNNGDIAAIRQHVPDAGTIAPMNQLRGFRGGANVIRGIRSGGFQVMGVYPDVQRIEYMEMREGRFINPIDVDDGRKVAVIGTRVQEVLFDEGEETIGSAIKINGVAFKVVGVFAPMVRGEQAMQEAEKIFLPFSTFQRSFNFGDEVGWFAITSRLDVPASVVEEKVKTLLRARHRIHPDDTRAIGSWNTEVEYLKVQGLFGGIRTLVWIVGIGTLAAGVIGVSNIMLIVVKERTKEIGLRRAIGATPTSVTLQIIMESVVLTGMAGYVGLLAGIGLIELVRLVLERTGANAQMFQNPGVSLGNAGAALAILIVCGALAGLIPARRAVAISPMEALHSV